ncbi:hypothetical protein AB3S75_027714 [Citrus x aurantiifolia]
MANKEPSLNIQSFHQCSSLVSIQLSPSNFLLWRSQVLPLARSLGVLHHLTEKEKSTAEVVDESGDKVPNPKLDAWINNDSLLTSRLLGNMTEEVLGMVVGAESAYEVWSSLEEQLLPMTREKVVHLTDQLQTLKKGSLTMDEYLRKFKTICDSLAAVNKPLDDVDKVFQLERGLGMEYKDFRVATLAKPPYPSFNQFFLALQGHKQMLLNEKDDRKPQVNYDQAFLIQQAFLSQRGRGRGNGGRFNSRGRGFAPAGRSGNNGVHNKNQKAPNNNEIKGNQSGQSSKQQQPQHEATESGKIVCQICFKANHTALECWNRFNYAYTSEDVPRALAAMQMEDEDNDPNFLC